MHRFFVPQLYNETMTIEGVDARHISKVLRMQPGAQLQIVSDDGVSALAEISAIDSECVTVHCHEKDRKITRQNYSNELVSRIPY